MSTDPPARLGEFATIAKFFAPLANAPGAAGLTDDVATVQIPAARELVVTTDALVEGVHFLRGDPADSIAAKALRVNLSDLAAKGAHAHGYLLTLCVAPWMDDAWLARFAAGLAADQERYFVSLLGGDTTATPGPLTLAITALGTIETGRVIRRAGAQPGDAVFVTGTLGDAGAGLSILLEEGGGLAEADRAALIGRYRLPEPRMTFGSGLVGLATASLDVSDGLLADLGHIASASRVRIAVEASRIPLSGSFRAFLGDGIAAVTRAAVSGDDYEIAFTAPESAKAAIAGLAREAGVPVTQIGRVEAGEGIALLDASGVPLSLERLGFTHF